MLYSYRKSTSDGHSTKVAAGKGASSCEF